MHKKAFPDKTMHFREVNINDYDYELPKQMIAQYPLPERDSSKLLILKDDIITQDTFKNLDEHVPSGSLLVFNNSRVIKARLLFAKDSGAVIEVLCLEPLNPVEYESSLSSGSPVEWKCIIGNLKKWKEGFISISFNKGGFLKAEKLHPIGDTWRVRFTWNDPSLSFAEVIEATGHVPLPPYITRSDEPGDMSTYQTVYSSVRGSVAAPTAGLHFTPEVLERLAKKGIKKEEVTLHVGAGTFQPVKSDLISEHKMHCEHFFVSSETIETLIVNIGRIIPVGTTSVRTIESLYWLGVKLLVRGSASPADFHVGQWEAYENQTDVDIITALNSLLQYMNANNLLFLHVSTSIIIVPGYNFRLTNGIITNFHQPRSTLLLLISAFTGEKWREVYAYALENNFRFLSYGDSSLIIGK